MKKSEGKNIIGKLKISRAAWCFVGIILLMVLLIAVFPQSKAVAVLENPVASVNGSTVNISFNVSGAPEEGMEATFVVVKKTETTGMRPPLDSNGVLDTMQFDPLSVANGENSLEIPIDGSLHGTALRIYIIGSDGTDPVFVDVDGVPADDKLVLDSTDESVAEEIVPFASVTASGVTVSGKVKSYNPQNAATICLMQGEVEVDKITTNTASISGQITHNFEFNGVQPGIYSLIITKEVHTKLTLSNLVVGEENVVLANNDRPEISVMTLRCGDINKDGLINDSDLTVLWQLANYNRNIENAANRLCDLNGDGMINDGDLTILWHVVNYNKGTTNLEMDTDPNKIYTVTFKDWDGTVLDIQYVTHGSSATPPLPPTRIRFLFTGWDGPYYDITSNTILTAMYAAQDGLNIFSVTNAIGKPGDIVTMSVSLGGTVNICAFEMHLVYDSDSLDYVSHNDNYDLGIISSHSEDRHAIAFNYSDNQNRIAFAKILEVSFKIKSTVVSSASVRILPVEVVYYDVATDKPTPVEYSVVNGTVTIN